MKSRVSLINILTNICFQVVTVISGLIIPRIILHYFGSGVNGLVSSLNQFLSYITLVEGGITGVVSANLYKPLINNDYEKLSSIMVTTQRFYQKVGLLFAIYSLLLSIVYPFVFKLEFDWIYVFSLTLILSINLMIQYMFSLSLRTLLAADKKGYIVSLTSIGISLLNLLLTYLSVIIFPSIHALKLISGSLYILQPVVYSYFIKKNYKLNWKAKEDSDILSQRWNGFAINLAAFIHNSTDVTVLTIFTSLEVVSVYSVYALVTSGLSRLILSINSAINPSLGQAYAKGDARELNSKLDLYEFICLFSVGFFFTLAGLLITPFVKLYTSGVNDVSYYQPVFGILIVLSESAYLIKAPHLSLSYCANKFKELTMPAFIEAFINIAVSVVLVSRLGLVGVSIGTLCAMIYRMMFHVYFTSKIVISRKQRIFYGKLMVLLFSTAIGILICVRGFSIGTVTISTWIVHGIIYSLIIAAIYLLAAMLFFKKEMRYIISYLVNKKA